MQQYRDMSGDSGVESFEIGPESIVVKFKKAGAYLYNYSIPGAAHVVEMQRLALLGDGLGAYINRYVKKKYASKL